MLNKKSLHAVNNYTIQIIEIQELEDLSTVIHLLVSIPVLTDSELGYILSGTRTILRDHDFPQF